MGRAGLGFAGLQRDRPFTDGTFVLGLGRATFREPEKRLLEIAKRFDVPTVHRTEKRKQPGPVVRIGMVENRQSLFMRETDFAKRIHQRSQVRRTEHRLRAWMQRAQIHQGLVNFAFATRMGQVGKGDFAGGQVKVTPRSHLNEFVRSNDVKFQWHTGNRFVVLTLGGLRLAHRPSRCGH